MIWALFSTIITSIGKIFFKKTLVYPISPELNDFFGHIGAIIGIITIVILGKFNFVLHSYWDYGLIILCFLFFFFQIRLNQYVFKNEKISVLVPYENLGKILTVLMGVFILKDDISTISLIFFLFTVLLIGAFGLNGKNLQFSKTVGIFCIAQVLSACANFLTGYILIHNSSLDYYTVYILFSVTFVFIATLFFKQWPELQKLDKTYYVNRIISSFTWIGWLIGILLIKEIGLSTTTLLSFLGVGISLLSSYYVFGDKPSKKNIILTLGVITLVSLGYIYK
ncbi:MAG: hypothetical protein GY828_06805 [Candidatus Gracilibacteria bacterium]|nr:hypothetical protein [Candidatus Gracilibacteria bacterium]